MKVKKSLVLVVCMVSLLALNCAAAFAAETESPAKAAMRKKLEEKRKAEGLGISTGDKSSGLLDLNKATKPQLLALPGIGEEEADKIIAGRPYISKTQLRQKKLLPSDTFYAIFDKVEVVIEAKRPVEATPVAPPASSQPKKNVWKDLNSKMK